MNWQDRIANYVEHHGPSLASAVVLRLDELTPGDRQLLHERHLASRELAGMDGANEVRSAAAVIVAEEASLMVNEEDHLRLQAFRSGFDVPGALETASRLDDELGHEVPYAFHQEFGFLTSCPTNTGTGMRASVRCPARRWRGRMGGSRLPPPIQGAASMTTVVLLLALSAGVLVSYKLLGGWRRSSSTSPRSLSTPPTRSGISTTPR